MSHLAETLDNGLSCYSDSHWSEPDYAGSIGPTVVNSPASRLAYETAHMRKHAQEVRKA